MVAINLNNYESYFMDYLDGNLSPSDKEQLFVFLEQNLNLKEELELLKGESLERDPAEFKEKQLLKKESMLGSGIKTNFDELCIAHLEGDLNKRESLEFEKLINEDLQKKKEYSLYQYTKIQAENTLVYSNKENLKRSIKKRIIFAKPYTYISAAASIAILLVLYFFVPKTNTNNIANNISNVEPIAEKSDVKIQDNIVGSEKVPQEIRNVKIVNNTEVNNELIQPTLEDKVEQQLALAEKEDRPKEQKVASLVPVQIEYRINKKHIGIKQNNSIYSYNELVQPQTTENYTSLKGYFARVLNKRLSGNSDKEKVELFDIAQAGVKGINKLTGSNMSLERVYDENGNPDRTAFNSRLIAFSTPLKKELK